MDSAYWNNFYHSNPDLSKPSPFAEHVVGYLLKNNIKINLFDAGCGNGRDTIFIAHNKLSTVGLDQSNVAITENKKHVKENMNSFLSYLEADFTTYNYDDYLFKNTNDFFALYSRFTWHAINYKEEELLLNNIKLSKKLKYLFIEARTIQDSIYGDGQEVGMHEFITTHYRRFIEPLDLIKKIKNCGFEINEFDEGVNFSKTDHENPHLLRIIAKKK